MIILRFSSVGISNGCKIHQPYAIIDLVSMEEFACCDGWNIIHVYDSTATLCGTIEGMGSHKFPRVHSVPAIEDDKVWVVLLCLGGSKYNL